MQHTHLREKKDYRGGSVPVGLGVYVCASCDDVPQPVKHPRPDYNPSYYVLDENGIQRIVTQDDEPIIQES